MGNVTSKVVKLLAGICFGITALTVQAWMVDPKIVVEKAFAQNALIVRFSEAKAASVELRVDGKPVATREVKSPGRSGEVTFDLNPDRLAAGDHKLDVVLYNQAGQKIGAYTSQVSIAPKPNAPVMLSAPKFGEQISGTYQVEVQVQKQINKPYVSLFVDRQLKEMRNVPPYRFYWDTTKETQGWHTLEAWAYDDNGNTHKSQAITTYVNNPGGRTERQEPSKPVVEGEVAGPSGENIGTTGVNGTKGVAADTVATTRGTGILVPGEPTRITEGVLAGAAVTIRATDAATAKAIEYADTQASGQKVALPAAVTPVTAAKVVVPKVGDVGIANQVATKNIEAVNTSATNTTRVAEPARVKATPVVVGAKPAVSAVKGPIEVATAKTTTMANLAVRTAPTLYAVKYGSRIANGSYSILFDGKPIKFDVQPRAIQGVPVAPFRYLFEYAGGDVKWDNAAKALTASKPGTRVNLRIGDDFALLNGSHVTMDMPAFLENGRTIVPLSFISDSLDVQVDYDAASGHMLITSGQPGK